MQHRLCLTAEGRTYFPSSFFWLRKAQGSTVCSEVEGAPLVELLFIYQIKRLGMQWRKTEEGKKKREGAKSWIIKNIRARYQWSRAAAAALWLSTNTRWIQAGQKPGGSKRTSVRQLLIFFNFFFSSRSRRRTGEVFVCGMNLWFMSPCTSDSLLPATCSEKTTNPFASHGPARLCPSMWTGRVRGVCVSRLSAQQFPRLTQLAREQLICFTNQQGETSGTRM